MLMGEDLTPMHTMEMYNTYYTCVDRSKTPLWMDAPQLWLRRILKPRYWCDVCHYRGFQ